jgi:hypothetical protein
MALKRNYYLNNALVEPPKNAQETSVKFNFEKDTFDVSGRPKLALSITDFEWARENNDTIKKHFEDGKIFEGLPLRYELQRNGITEKVFDGYIDLTDNARFNRNTSIVTSKQRKNIDWLNDTADSVSFEYLESIGVITSNDYKFMPYVLNKIPDYQEAAISILSAYALEKQLEKALTDLGGLITDLSNPLTSPNTIIKSVAYIIYLIGLIATSLLLLKKIVLYLIQPIKYHACMNVKTILEKGASHFGFTFKSDVLNKEPFNRLVFMPEKRYNAIDPNTGIFGFTKPDKILQRGYPDGTFGDFLREIKKAFKSKIVINENSELILVPEYFNSGSPQYKLPDLYQPEFTTNASELKSNYVLSFSTDLEDKNTIQEYLGTTLQVITRFKTAVPSDLSLLKNIEDIQLPFALAKTKTELSIVEIIIKEFLGVFSSIINALISVANGVIVVIREIVKGLNAIIKILSRIGIHIPFTVPSIPLIQKVDLGNIIERRIGMMKIETDLFTVPKLFLLTQGNKDKNNKISPENKLVVSAKYFYLNFHKPVVSFLPSLGRPNGNQYIIKQFDKVPFVFEDMTKVINNNSIFTSDNKDALIDDGEWNDFNEEAKLTVRISQTYATGLEEVYLEPNGR